MSIESKPLQGKICLITGATNGIGKATAYGLARRGATVVIVARNRERGEIVQREIQTQTGNEAIDLLLADLSSQEEIRQLAANFQQRYSQLDVLINNAGVFMLKRIETIDGLETTFAVNHLASVLLTNLLLDVLKTSAPARVINVNSDAHRSGKPDLNDLQLTHGYNVWKAYACSKQAQLLYMYELARRIQDTKVTVNCVHPGFVFSNIGMNNAGPRVQALVKPIFARLGTTPEQGASTSLFLATSPEVEQVTGKYFEKSRPVRSSPLSYNQSLQGQMWEISNNLVHIQSSQPAKLENG